MAGGGQLALGGGFLEELVGLVAAGFGIGEDGGERGPGYRDPETGQLRPAEKTYPTKTDAQAALTHVESDITRGQWSDPDAGAVNFEEYATAWLRDRKLAASGTSQWCGLHILPTFGAGSVADVTTTRVRSWRGRLLAAGIGEPTVVKAYQLLRALMNTAVDEN